MDKQKFIIGFVTFKSMEKCNEFLSKKVCSFPVLETKILSVNYVPLCCALFIEELTLKHTIRMFYRGNYMFVENCWMLNGTKREEVKIIHPQIL